jgi:hypothetical protein
MARERIDLLLGVCSARGNAETRGTEWNGGWSNDANYESTALELGTELHHTLR